jgi:hypothetical protein
MKLVTKGSVHLVDREMKCCQLETMQKKVRDIVYRYRGYKPKFDIRFAVNMKSDTLCANGFRIEQAKKIKKRRYRRNQLCGFP